MKIFAILIYLMIGSGFFFQSYLRKNMTFEQSITESLVWPHVSGFVLADFAYEVKMKNKEKYQNQEQKPIKAILE